MSKETKVLNIVRSMSRKRNAPGLDESLFEAGFLDSFALVDLVAALESEFAIQIPDSDLNPVKFESVSRIVEYLEARG